MTTYSMVKSSMLRAVHARNPPALKSTASVSSLASFALLIASASIARTSSNRSSEELSWIIHRL